MVSKIFFKLVTPIPLPDFAQLIFFVDFPVRPEKKQKSQYVVFFTQIIKLHCITPPHVFLASQDAQEVMMVTHSLSQ